MKNSEIKKVVYNNVYQNTSNGYVLTPSELAFEMVSTLPDSVFKSDSTTFLDPICKSGTFLFEIVERLYEEGHSISNIQNRIYTIDSNSHSLNVANSYIKKILNRESGYFKIDFKSEFVEKYFNRLVNVVTSGKYSTFEDFMNIILLDKKENYLMVELKRNISEFIEKYEKVSKLESKLFGEVFTPRQLIDEMLDTLPAEVWKNKDLKWLDPAVGIGNFPAAILDRLMVGLDSVIPNEDERRKWILEEMLYMCDISIKNLFLLYKLFDENNEFKLNVYRGSFLTEDFDKWMKEVWGLEGFDVVVGNPPYQDGSKEGGQNKIYNDFCKKSFDIISKNGMINYVTPISVLKKSKRFSLIGKRGLRIVNFSSDSHFNVGINICSWLYDSNHNSDDVFVISKNGLESIIKNDNEIIDFSSLDVEFLNIKNSLKRVASSPDKRMFFQNPVDATNGRSKNISDIFKYPVYKISKNVKVISQYNKPIPKLHRYNKIIFPYTKSLYKYIVDDLDYDVNHLFTNVDNESQIENILSFILSDYFIDHCDKWKKSDGYGFNNALKFLPPFDKEKRWDNHSVEIFLKSFI
jgi:hypothetical protein